MNDELPSAPAAQRNREPIARVLHDVLPKAGVVLEVASGTGEHAEYFARQFPGLQWQPSDGDDRALEWIVRRRQRWGLANLRDPIRIDASEEEWPLQQADAVVCINMVHISAWAATEGLMRGAARLLEPGSPLILYGPYLRDDVPTAPSNIDFDRSLKDRNPVWGVRRLEDVRAVAERNGLAFERLVEMPANNLSLVFRRG